MKLTNYVKEGITMISKRDNTPEGLLQHYAKEMIQYQREGAKFGNDHEGFLKWKNTQKKSVK